MNAQIAHDLEQLQRFLTCSRVEGESRTTTLLRKSRYDAVIHVEVKGHGKGTRRERRGKR